MRPKKQQAQQEDQAPGAFTSEGLWNPNAELVNRGDTHRFVEAMVSLRRQGKLTPEGAANAIIAANQQAAFPNHPQWLSVWEQNGGEMAVWPLVWTATSAEEAVKRCGRPDGHWCGEDFRHGVEKDCPDWERHRAAPMPAGGIPIPEAVKAVAK